MMVPSIVLTALVALSPSFTTHAFYLDPNGQKLASPPTSTTTSETLPFRPWPQPCVESHGDYRDDAWLESHIGGPLYEKQAELPNLPIPDISATIQRFLPTALPLASSKEEQDNLMKACQAFPQQAKILQERLIHYKEKSCQNASWLQHWWQTQGYLQVRNSLLEVSYFLFIPDDTSLSDVDGDTATTTNLGVARAAAALVAMAESRKLICSGTMPYEHISQTPLCSTGFKYLFHSSRMPQPNQDIYHLYDPSRFHHVIVACQGQFYRVEIVNDQGDPLPLSVLEQRLNQCVDMATQQCLYPQMGWLTSVDRDVWTRARQELLDKGGNVMKEALETMESGAFCLNFKVHDQPTTMTDAANVFWKDGNRWMDKSLQLDCTANGKMAYVGEHSMLDAAPVIPLIKRIIKTTYHRLSSKQAQEEDELTSILEANDDNGGVVNVFEECWKSPELTETAVKLTTLAKQQYQQLASEYECQVLEFTGYGKKLIKGAGFVCHDLVQQALQLAAHRYFGHQVGTYEAALTRIFLHGRTETARPVSPQSKAFVECMGMERNDDKSREEKLALLKQAAAVHDEYQNAACNGQGVDRHFFGLSNMVQEGEAVPALFSDPLFLRSKNWKLSTSSVIFTPGFGPSTEDGVAIGYRVEANQCTFTCTSRSDNHAVEPFLQILEQVLTEIGELLREE